MDAARFDALIRRLGATPLTRGQALRGLTGGVLATVLGAAFAANESSAKKKKKKKKKKRKPCQAASDAETCAGRCGAVSNSCGLTINCGPCACTPPCPACQTCNGVTGQCQPDPGRVGQTCGTCLTCRADGQCATVAPNRAVCAGSGTTISICCNGVCCAGCCGTDEACGACRAFVTGGGSFGAANGKIGSGGLAGADALCQGAAGEGALPGSYKAWLSDSTASPQTRFRCAAAACSREGYVRVDGEVIATDWDDLTDGTLAVPISVTPFGDEVVPGTGTNTWSHTKTDGSAVESDNHCRDWTCSFDCDEEEGDQGQSLQSDAGWTENGSVTCEAPRRLYCFQQD